MAHRDDLLVNDTYPLASLHSEEKGVKIRSEIYKVTVLLSVVTIVEVFLGIYVKQDAALWAVVKIVFILLTLFKAAYIVSVFMHLGSEKKGFKKIILYPYYILIIYLLIILIFEANYQFDKINMPIF